MDFDKFYKESAFVKATGISKKDFARSWIRIFESAIEDIKTDPAFTCNDNKKVKDAD